ncbi:MAG: bacillithiol biosynthesis deacetylase BshB1 [Acidobacteriaceae bacterium]|nr:bacillithiol biosynthesis deacetylase BshB1 [Acidobacteriaceae bacterium]
MPVDVLLFGAHPDDVEWGAGGTALLLKRRAAAFAIVDLTGGEMGSRGTAVERRIEAERAADYLGAAGRECLNMSDGALADSPEARKQVAAAIRQHRPRLVLAPYWEDRHPDHSAAGLMIRNSALCCTSRKSEDPNPPHKPDAVLYYLLHHFTRPSIVVDISSVYENKLELIRVHESQFAKSAAGFGVIPHGLGDYIFGLESRDRFFGSLIGVHHGEALVSEVPLSIGNLSYIAELLR